MRIKIDDGDIDKIKERFSRDIEFEKRNLALYRQLSGINLAKEIASSCPSLVLDFGCGANIFKRHIPNLIGLDIVEHIDVDLVIDVNQATKYFAPNSADWILNFGPIQYGKRDWVDHMVNEMKTLISNKGIIVCHASPDNDWNKKYIIDITEAHNLKLISCDISFTDMSRMSEKDLEIQKKVSEWSDLKSDGTNLISERITWRWKKLT